jgi:hypothetical protein
MHAAFNVGFTRISDNRLILAFDIDNSDMRAATVRKNRVANAMRSRILAALL